MDEYMQRQEDGVRLPMAFSRKQEYLPQADDFQGPNILIGAKYQSTLLENKILALALSKADQIYYSEKHNPTVQITAAEIRKALGIKSHSIYQELEPLAKSMTGRVMGITDPENNFFDFVSVIARAKYENGVFYISFNNELSDSIFNLEKRYTLLSLKMLMSFKSVYSFRIYEILRSVSFQRTHYAQRLLDGGYSFVMNVSELKLECGVVELSDREKRYLDSKNPDYDKAVENAANQKYREWRNFKRHVLDVAHEEICASSDIWYDMEFIRGRDRKITKINFIVHYKVKPGEDEADVVDVKDGGYQELPGGNEADVDEAAVDAVIKLAATDPPLKRRDAISMLSAANGDVEKVRRAFEYAEAYPKDISNLTAFIISAIKEDYGVTAYTLKNKKKAPAEDVAANAGMSRETYDRIHNFPEHNYDFAAIEKRLNGD